MDTVIAIVIALPFGLAFGSFLTVVVHRVPEGESLVRPRSRCPSCGTRIRAVDNIPVISWLLLRGRCRSCRARISAIYPLLELGSGILFVAVALRFDDPWVAVMLAPFLSLLAAISVIDIRHRIIPNRIVYPASIAFAAYLIVAAVAGGEVDLARAAIGCIAYGGVLLIVALLVPRGMGMGDVKLTALIGLVLGSLGLGYVAVAGAAGVVLGGVGALVALAAGASRKNAIPFGPYLAAGAAVATFAGPQIADAYLRLLKV